MDPEASNPQTRRPTATARRASPANFIILSFFPWEVTRGMRRVLQEPEILALEGAKNSGGLIHPSPLLSEMERPPHAESEDEGSDHEGNGLPADEGFPFVDRGLCEIPRVGDQTGGLVAHFCSIDSCLFH